MNKIVLTADAVVDPNGHRLEVTGPVAVVANDEDLRLEVVQLREALDEFLQGKLCPLRHDRLIDVMQRRYGRETRQWRANHDQRKAERDAARARVAELEAALACALAGWHDLLDDEYGEAAQECRPRTLATLQELAKLLPGSPPWLT